jgi:methyl-accepting chemotaxis protein
MKLTWKILIPLVVTATALIGVLIWQSVSTHINLLTAKDVAELENFYSLFTSLLEEREEKMLALSNSIANMPDVQQSLAEQDREELARMVLPIFQPLQEGAGVSVFHFHVPPATSFFRAHKPEKHSDDLSFVFFPSTQAGKAQR